MTTRALQLLECTMELSMRPKSKDRQKLIARVINEVADRLCTDCGELEDPVSVLREIADEVEAVVGVSKEERPALRGLRVVHAGDKCLVACQGSGAEPATDRKGLFRIEVTDLAEVEVGAFLDSDGAAMAAFLNPGGSRAVHLGLRRDTGAFVKREATKKTLRGDVLVEVGRLELGEPNVEVLNGCVAEVACLFLGGFNLFWERDPAWTVGVGGQVDHGAATILHVAVEAGLGRVAEEGRQRIEILLRERVELVVVALGAVGRQAEVDPAHRLDAVGGVVGEVLLDDRAALVGRHVAALQARGDQLGFGRVRQEVAGELFDREGVEGLVAIEGLDHPVTVGPHRALRVALEAVGVGVAGEVEPLHRHVLTVVRGGEETVEGLGPGFRRVIGEESLQVGVGGWQAGEVEGGAAKERGLRGVAVGLESLGGERSREESIDGVAAGRNLRDGRLDRNLEGPVTLVFGAFFDPLFDEGDLGFGEHLMELRRRHVVVRVVGAQTLHYFAFFRVARQDRRFAGLAALARRLERIQTELTLDLVLVGAVTGVARVREDRADVAIELNLLGGSGECPEQAGGDETKAGKAHGVSVMGQLRRPRVHSNVQLIKNPSFEGFWRGDGGGLTWPPGP